jgi:hypothetical protein
VCLPRARLAAFASRWITCALLSFLLSADRFWVGGAAAPFRACRACRCVLVASLTIASHARSIWPFFDAADTVPPRARSTVRTAPTRQRRRACSACADDGSSSCDRPVWVPFRPRARFQYNQTSERTKVVLQKW